MKDKRSFVIMPFSATAHCTEAEWTEIFTNVFKPALEEVGYECQRASPSVGSLSGSIIEQLHTASVVLADLTDQNPNVFYELGIRHSLSKRTILVAQDFQHVPSDLRGYWCITYGIRPAEVAAFRQEVKRLTLEIEADPEKSDSPVADYLQKSGRQAIAYINRENLRKLSALCTELSGNAISLERNTNLVRIDCLTLLLQTLYIDLGPQLLAKAYELRLYLAHLFDHPDGRDPNERASELTIEFLEGLAEVRSRLAMGIFHEPREPSLMLWVGGAVGGRCTDILSELECVAMPNYTEYLKSPALRETLLGDIKRKVDLRR